MAINYLQTLTLGVLLIFCLSCSQTPPATANKAPEIKKGVTPVADAEVAVIEMEQPAYGKVTIELYSNLAPVMVARFKELAREGFYNGTAFHRINPTVVQGGDPVSRDYESKLVGSGKSNKPNVPAEFSDIPYDSGIVGAARGPDLNSQNCQFFMTLKREQGFDQKYTIFGKVIDGMNNVRTIAGVPRDGEKPLEPVRIKSVSIEARK
jgi:peptidyl-prolyl cis-trans isomerase B (cyclophilin B)